MILFGLKIRYRSILYVQFFILSYKYNEEIVTILSILFYNCYDYDLMLMRKAKKPIGKLIV